MVSLLFEEFAKLPQVEAIALGGSRAGEHFDEKSDYDVYVYCLKPIAEDVRRQILEKHCSYMEIGNQYWETEDNCILNNGIDIDILYRNLEDFCAGVAGVVEQYRPSNGYTTCMWHNLKTCKALYDRNGRLAAAKNRFDVPYPDELKTAIVNRAWNLLHRAMPAYEAQILKAAERKDFVSINHRTAAFLEAYFDLLFALNRQTHPGEKRLMQLCRERCPILPGDFEQNLTALFSHMFTEPEKLAADLQIIVQETAKIL